MERALRYERRGCRFESCQRYHAGVMQLEDIAVSNPAFWWFESTCRQMNTAVAQRIEHCVTNAGVAGSNPAGGANYAGVMQLEDIAALKSVSWWFESTRRQNIPFLLRVLEHFYRTQGLQVRVLPAVPIMPA